MRVIRQPAGARSPLGEGIVEDVVGPTEDGAGWAVSLHVGDELCVLAEDDLEAVVVHPDPSPERVDTLELRLVTELADGVEAARAADRIDEEIRGVITSKGTLDVLLETGWIRPRGRRKTPGRPLTFGTTEAFLSQFSLEALSDLPGLEELKGTGLLDSRLPTGFSVPTPSDDPALREDEDPLEIGDLELALAPAVEPESDDKS